MLLDEQIPRIQKLIREKLGALPKNAGIGMPHTTAYGLVTSILAPLLVGSPLQGFIPFLTSQNTLASVAGLGLIDYLRLPDRLPNELLFQNDRNHFS